MKIVAVVNQKGGAGKSTTAITLAAGLCAKSFKTLIVDMDAQGNASLTAGAIGTDANIYEVLTNSVAAAKAIQDAGGFGDIIPASAKLSKVERELADELDRYHRLKEALKIVKYDYVIIDTPPNLGTLTINALTAADGCIIPTGADEWGTNGIRQLHGTIESVRKNTNRQLQIYGILLTRHAPSRRLLRDYAENVAELAKEMGTKVFSNHIRDNIVLREAQACRQTIFEYDPNSIGAKDYSAFITEFISINKGKGGKNAKKRNI